MTTGALPRRRWSALRERLPAWTRSPMLLVPLSVALMLVLLISFASVVSEIVHQGAAGNAEAPSAATSPAPDRV